MSEHKEVTAEQILEESKISFSSGLQYALVLGAMEEYAQIKIAAIRSSQNKLQKFKEYVHDRLDKMGVPSDPEPENNAQHGCRIEGRLNYLQKKTLGWIEPSPAQEVEKPDFDEYPDVPAAHHSAPILATLVDSRQVESLKDKVKKLEQEAFFVKQHRDSAQEEASSLRAIIKSLEAENEELRKKIERDNDRLKGYTD